MQQRSGDQQLRLGEINYEEEKSDESAFLYADFPGTDAERVIEISNLQGKMRVKEKYRRPDGREVGRMAMSPVSEPVSLDRIVGLCVMLVRREMD